MLEIVPIIEKKKFGKALTPEEIRFFVDAAATFKGNAKSQVKDYQLSALLMAIRLNGMTREETAEMTLAMAQSGDMVDLSALKGIPTDKHSTGGVGDTTTLVLAPLVAACGVPVAKMSGRGLGHTGGTLDKLESIAGLSTAMDIPQFMAQVEELGCAVIGQSQNLAPADKVLYGLRDVTGTVDSLPLIAASIMSKKLASGAQAIVLDVKTGAGALMHTIEESIALAQTMVRIGEDAGRKVVALITDMGEPLGSHVGNALEVKEAIDVLAGRVKGPLLEVALELGGHMLCLGGAAEDMEEAKEKLRAALDSGKGLETLAKMIQAQGGDPKVCQDVSLLPQAKVIREVPALESGWVQAMDTIELGNTAQGMGAGRKTKNDVIDYSVGFVLNRRIGEAIKKGEALATVYAKSEASAQEATQRIQQAIQLSGGPCLAMKLVHAVVTTDSMERL